MREQKCNPFEGMHLKGCDCFPQKRYIVLHSDGWQWYSEEYRKLDDAMIARDALVNDSPEQDVIVAEVLFHYKGQ